MKIVCEIRVHNRLAPHVLSRPQQSTLALGYHPPGGAKDADNLFLIHFTATNKVGIRYKIKRNIDKVFTKFVQDGKTTLSFKQPPHDLQVRCDVIQLKCFLQTLKLAIEGKFEPNKLGLSTLAVTPVPQKSMPIKTMTITTPSDYPVRGLPKTISTLNINGIRKHSIDAQILSLSNLRILNLSNNCIERIPKRLGEIPLVQLDLSQNSLGKSTPFSDWCWLDGRILRASLQSLNLSENQLSFFPYQLVKLSKLTVLILKNNQLTRIPFAIRRMKSLRHFNLSENQIHSLPNVMSRMFFDTLDVSGVEMFPKQLRMYTLCHDRFHLAHSSVEMRQPSKLWQLAARIVISKKIKYMPNEVPADVIDLLEESPYCDCGQLCSPIKLHFRTCQIRPMANHMINSHGICGLYGDSVYCSEYCRLVYQKFYFDE